MIPVDPSTFWLEWHTSQQVFRSLAHYLHSYTWRWHWCSRLLNPSHRLSLEEEELSSGPSQVRTVLQDKTCQDAHMTRVHFARRPVLRVPTLWNKVYCCRSPVLDILHWHSLWGIHLHMLFQSILCLLSYWPLIHLQSNNGSKNISGWGVEMHLNDQELI